MDWKLEQFLERADYLHYLCQTDNPDYPQMLDELKNNIQNIQSIVNRLTDIHNAINQQYRKNTTFLSRKLLTKNVNPTSDDWKNQQLKNIEVAPDVKIKSIVINTLAELPNYNIYYVNEINNFAFQINGVVFNGHIGNITKKPLQKKCKRENCQNPKCSLFHGGIRNFSTGCWMYSSIINEKTKNMRHIGNRQTLFQDITRIENNPEKNNEIELWDSQAIHTILTTLALHQNIKI